MTSAGGQTFTYNAQGQQTFASGTNLTQSYDGDGVRAKTGRNVNSVKQPQRYTSYLRDANQSDEAMFRRYNRWWSRFDQPDPYDGSYDLTNPQSFNRYAYSDRVAEV